MNIPLLIATVVTCLTVLLHIFGGGPQYHDAYQQVLTSPELAAMAAVLWHAVTVCLIVFAAALAWLARHPNRPLAIALSAMQFGWAALFVFYGITMLGTLWIMPQWVIFCAIPLLTLYGSRQPRPT